MFEQFYIIQSLKHNSKHSFATYWISVFRKRMKSGNRTAQSLANDQQLSHDLREKGCFKSLAELWQAGRWEETFCYEAGRERQILIYSLANFKILVENGSIFVFVWRNSKDLSFYWDLNTFSLTSRLCETFLHLIFGIFLIINLF